MLFVLVVLAVSPFAVAYGGVYALNAWGADVAASVLGYRWYGEFYVQPVRAVAAFGGLFAVTYWLQRNRAVSLVNPGPSEGVERPALAERVDRLAEAVGVADPELVATASERPAALTVGLNPREQTLVVTDGLREALSDDELDAVLVHELAHQRNRDVAVRSAAATALSLLYVLALPWVAVRELRTVAEDSREMLLVIVLVVFGVLTFLVALPFFAARVAFARSFSHYAEHVADSATAAVVDDPDALADAFGTLRWSGRELEATLLFDALATVPADDLADESDGNEGVLDRLSTLQPPIGERIDRLRAIAEDA